PRPRAADPPAETGEARIWIGFLQHRSGEEDPRAGPSSRFDCAAVARDVVELAAEVEHRGDTGSEKKLGMPFVRRVDVHVHVHETWGEKPAPGVDHRGARRDRRGRSRADRRHSIAVDDDRRKLTRTAARPVDKGAADYRNHGCHNISKTVCFSDT